MFATPLALLHVEVLLFLVKDSSSKAKSAKYARFSLQLLSVC